jgi:hypothetical protein
MIDKNPVIIFAGDSFTWGEGLELYTPTSKWETQRNCENTWQSLYPKIDYDAKKFRIENRFPNIVSNHLGIDAKVFEHNGGNISTPIEFVNRSLKNKVGYTPYNVKAIVFQFTIMDRVLLHLDTSCQCEFCKVTGCDIPLNLYTRVLHKKLNNITVTDIENWAVNYLNKHEDIPIHDINYNTIHSDINDYFKPIFNRNLKLLLDKYINQWSTIAPVYFIDSWDMNTSNLLHNINEYSDNMIPLKGHNGNYYKKWHEWESTFPNKRIWDDLPNTRNGHPTLLQHQYIGESITEYFKK